MELKVWVEGIQRIVCGVTETTTCQDVVFALAHATGKSGRFTLIERWRHNERQLAPNENPLQILMKWGEYSNDVQFILQCNDNSKSQISLNKCRTPSNPGTPTSQTSSNITVDSPEKHKETMKPLTFITNHHASPDLVGVVKGVPQVRTTTSNAMVPSGVRESLTCTPPHGSPSRRSVGSSQGGGGGSSDKSSSDSPSHHQHNQQYQQQYHYQQQRAAPPYKDPPAPPPYRDPPAPPAVLGTVNRSTGLDKRNNIVQDTNKQQKEEIRNKFQESVLNNAQYKELVALINYQRQKLSSQQADLTKYDAEIVFWEGKEREKQMQLDYIAQEVIAMTNSTKVNQEQIQALCYVEEESEIVKQQEKTLKSEITLLRSKLANCETELLQCKNKIRLVMDEFQLEQRAQSRRNESRKQMERNILAEVERLQRDIEIAKQSTELHHLTAENLKKEVAALELAIIEKKKQVEHLVAEMKEANLQSLSIAPPEDLRQILEGANKPGSTRKMIGSPRQLENAVPTNKNPHGVWV